MHLVYDTRTGAVVDGPITSSAWPDGAPDDQALINVAEADRRHMAVLRWDDRTDDIAATQQMATTHQLLVQGGKVVQGDPHPPPPPDPVADARNARDARSAAVLQPTVGLLTAITGRLAALRLETVPQTDLILLFEAIRQLALKGIADEAVAGKDGYAQVYLDHVPPTS